MNSFLFRLTFAQNPITHAERTYQQGMYQAPRHWLRTVTKWLVVAISLIVFGMAFVTSYTDTNPAVLIEQYAPLMALLIIVAAGYHIYLMFHTMILAANSISREKEGLTWDLLVLTGINARQIVRGKWWAIIQLQFRRYLLLSLLRTGVAIVLGVAIGSYTYKCTVLNFVALLYPNVLTLVLCAVFGTIFTLANLAITAACGVLGSVSSRSSAAAIVRGFTNQIFLTLLVTAPVIYAIHQRLFYYPAWSIKYLSSFEFLYAGLALLDSGLMVVSSPLYGSYRPRKQNLTVSIGPTSGDWVIAVCIALLLSIFLIWLTLWRAEKSAIAAMATPVNA